MDNIKLIQSCINLGEAAGIMAAESLHEAGTLTEDDLQMVKDAFAQPEPEKIDLEHILNKIDVLTAENEAMRSEVAAYQTLFAREIPDEKAIELATLLRVWTPGDIYVINEAVSHNEGVYRLINAGDDDRITALAHQPPDAPGMNSVWARVDTSGAAGTAKEPIPFVIDMRVEPGLYYSYSGAVYQYTGAEVIKPCIATWAPGSAGVHFWRVVT